MTSMVRYQPRARSSRSPEVVPPASDPLPAAPLSNSLANSLANSLSN